MCTPLIIYEDNHLLIVQKPAGLLSQPDASQRPDMLTWAQAYLSRSKPGRAYVGLTQRLDRAVGGVMALAKTSKAAARLSRQFRERTAGKIYLALVSSPPPRREGRLEENLVRDGSLTRAARPGEKGRPAILSWSIRARERGLWLLEINLLTGFKHQIRAQLAQLDCPVAGDRRYGSPLAPKGPAIGLWAESLSIEHPTWKEALSFKSPPPARQWPWSELSWKNA